MIILKLTFACLQISNTVSKDTYLNHFYNPLFTQSFSFQCRIVLIDKRFKLTMYDNLLETDSKSLCHLSQLFTIKVRMGVYFKNLSFKLLYVNE